jgi:hypothetical protein
MRKLYTMDQVQDLMFDSVDASLPVWRRWRANRIYNGLLEATKRQAGIVADTRFARLMRDFLRQHAGESVIVAAAPPRWSARWLSSCCGSQRQMSLRCPRCRVRRLRQ